MQNIIVLGAGIIGLSIAYTLYKAGVSITVIDRDPAGDKVSFGNAGSIAVMEVNPASVPGVFWKVPGWMLNPLGPLSVRPNYSLKLLPWLYRFYLASKEQHALRSHQALVALNTHAYRDMIPMFTDIGVIDALKQKGALVVYESDIGFQQDQNMWALRIKSGIITEYLSGDDARKYEPALGERVKHGMFVPQAGYVTDPKYIVDQLRTWLIKHGVKFIQDEVNSIQKSPNNMSVEGRKTVYTADKVVLATGAWSSCLTKQQGEKCYLESERGYNTTIKNPDIKISREIVFAERKFVITPLTCGLRIGGAAEFGGLNNPPNYKRSDTLVKLAQLYFPDLKQTIGTVWSGHRPSTPDSLPVISRSMSCDRLFYAFGHGHLGLTQCAITARLIKEMIFNETSDIDTSMYSIERFN